MRRPLWLLLALPLLCAATPADDTVVAEASGAHLTAGDIRQLLASLDPGVRAQIEKDPALLDRLVRSQMVQMLLLQEAHAHQWDARPDIAFRAQQAHDAVIANSWLASQATLPADYPSDADVQAAYQAQKERLIIPRQYHLAQIFIAQPANASAAAQADAKRRLAALRQQLAKPHADFAAIARQESDEKSTAGAGGDLGWLPEDRLQPAVRDAVVGMQEGAVGEPIHMEDGWHVIRLIATKPAGPAPLDDVRAQLVQALRQQRIAESERKLVDDLLRRQPVRIDEIGIQHAIAP